MVKQGIFQNLKGCADVRESATSGAEEVTWEPLRRDFRSENSGCLSLFVFPFFAYQFLGSALAKEISMARQGKASLA
jgi:hypothetical protein